MTVLLRSLADYANYLYGVCALAAIWYLRVALSARRERRQSAFSLEREAAFERTRSAFYVALVLAGVMGGVYYISKRIAPNLPVLENPVYVTPTVTLRAGGTGTRPATASVEATATTAPIVVAQAQQPAQTSPPPPSSPTPLPPTPTRPRPTATAIPQPSPLPQPSPVPPLAPAFSAARCSDPRAALASPGVGQHVNGAISVSGTAQHANLQYWKLEFAPGTNQPDGAFHYILSRPQAVVNGFLGVWDTSGLAAGVYTLRLLVVDKTGNFLAPCDVPVTVG